MFFQLLWLFSWVFFGVLALLSANHELSLLTWSFAAIAVFSGTLFLNIKETENEA